MTSKKIKYHIIKHFINYLVYFNGKLYMRFLNKLLRTTEMKINGTPRFIAKSVRFDDFSRISIGDRLVISMNVYFLTHDYSYTTALIALNEGPSTDIGILRSIEVGDNVFIGMNSIIMPGTKIGDNVIIGAGSVVRGVVPNNSVISGNPATVIGDIREYGTKVKSRDNQGLIIDKK